MAHTEQPTVIVINDERNIRSVLTSALERQGVSVAAFERGAAALDDPRLAYAKLITADWTNAPICGLELWQALRARNHPAPVMFVSPHAGDIAALFASDDVKPAAFIDVFIARKLVAQALDLLGHPVSVISSLS